MRLWLGVIGSLCLFLAATVAPAQDGARKSDGRYWLKLSVDEKYSYIDGFLEGYNLAILLSQTDYNKAKVYVDLVPFSFTFGEIVEMIDSFYKSPENRQIRTNTAFTLITAKARGSSQDEYDAAVARARREASK